MGFNIYQQEAIDTIPGENILISAGAGSGKTKTLSYKVYKTVMKDGIDPSSLLVLTFTNKAAYEMKERIIKQFKDENSEYADQIISSHIQTFDSFSLYLAKKYSVRLGIPSNVTIIDESILKSKKQTYLDEIINEYYEKDFERIVSSFKKFNVKRDTNSKTMILQIDEELNKLMPEKRNDFINNYDSKYLSKEFLNQVFDDIVLNLKHNLKEKLREIIFTYNIDKFSVVTTRDSINAVFDKWNLNDETIFNYETTQILYKALIDFYSLDNKEFIKQLQDADSEESKFKELLNGSKHKAPAVNKAGLGEATAYKSLQELTRDLIAKAKTIDYDIDSNYDLLLSLKDDISLIFEIINKLNQKLDLYKESNNAYTFSDISYKALKLLTEEKYDDIASEIKERFKYILVDEYQDTNDIQELFLNKLSEKATLFCVGDAKQAIYAFRNSKVQLFLDRRDRFNLNPSEGKVINMNWNYRSHRKVLNDINCIFKNYMNNTHGGIKYSNIEEQLNFDPKFERKEVNGSEYGTYLLETEENSVESECKAIIKDIKTKIDSHYQVFCMKKVIVDGEEKEVQSSRDCRYSDFAILMKVKKAFPDYIVYFKEANIPLNSETEEHLTKVDAVMTLQSLLKLVADDIRIINHEESKENRLHLFLSLARSYLYGTLKSYDDNKIANLVFNSNDWEKDEIMNKVFSFALNHQNQPLSLLFNDLLKEFNVIDNLKHVGQVNENIAKIESFALIIKGLESQGQSLFDFITTLDSIKKNNIEIKSDTIDNSENAVKLMTIHKSKGLEFPIVYLPFTKNAYKKHTDKDITKFSNEYGILLPRYELNKKAHSFLNFAYNNFNKKNQVEIDEYVRLNYVALTRAGETIYFVGNLDKTVPDNSLAEMILSLTNYPKLTDEIIKNYESIIRKTEDNESDPLMELDLYKNQYLDLIDLRERELSNENVNLDKLAFLDKIIKLYYKRMKEYVDTSLLKIQNSFKEKVEGLTMDELASIYAIEKFNNYEIASVDELLSLIFKNALDIAKKANLIETREDEDSEDEDEETDEEEKNKKEEINIQNLEELKKTLEGYQKDIIAKKELNRPLLIALINYFDKLNIKKLSEYVFVDKSLKIKEIDINDYDKIINANKSSETKIDLSNPVSLNTDFKEIKFKKRDLNKRASIKEEEENVEESDIVSTEEENEKTYSDKQAAMLRGTYLHKLLEIIVKRKSKDTSFIKNSKDRAEIDKVLSLPIFDDIKYAKSEYQYFDEEYQSEGIIDCLIVKDDEIKIIDYKTSSIDNPGYVEQLKTYKRNIERIFNTSNIKCYLLSLKYCNLQEIDVDK